MTNLEQVSKEELGTVRQLTCLHIPVEKLRTAEWSIDQRSSAIRMRALIATIDGQIVIACLFPRRVGPPDEKTTYEIGWIATEEEARKILPS